MKKNRKRWTDYWCVLKKPLLMMKWSLFFLILSVFQANAYVGFAQKTQLSLDFKGTSIESILNEIENQSDYYFLYNKDLVDVNRKVDIEVADQNINSVLDQLFNNSEVIYRIFDRQVVLSQDENIISNLSLQVKKLTGKVTDTSGAPLPGVTVVVKGTTNGTITNFDGVYTLADVPSDATIQFSFVGMKLQEIPVSGKTSIDVVMEEDAIGIEEVVAVGYGTMKKSDLTGAVGTVQGSIIADRQTTQVSEALQGSIPGVMVTRSNGKPNSSATIRIRGITTIGDSSPLVIVDGVPGVGIDDINPNDIESISVLKDGASASIYGSRAAAGVILITTKRAKEGISEFNYNLEYGVITPSELPEYTDAIRYMEMMNEQTWNSNGNNDNEYPIFSKDLIDNYSNLNSQNPDIYPNTDWQGLIFRSIVPRQSHLFSFRVGTKNVRTSGSFNYEKVGVLYDLDNADFDRYTARINNDITINSILSASIDVFFKSDNNYESSYDPISKARSMPPIYTAVYADGRIASAKASENPYGLFKYGGFNESIQNRLGAKASIDFKPLKGLKISAVLSPNISNYKKKLFEKAVPAYMLDDPSTIENYLYGRNSTSLSEARNEGFNITKQFFVDYTTNINDSHNVKLLAGYEDYYSKSESLGASRDEYDLNDYPYLNIGNENYQYNSGYAYEYAYRSFFGRFVYDFSNKYLFQANIRYDGSSRFHKNHRWGLFPSFSLGWVLSEESFLESNSTISFLKLRSSWGQLGNERIGNYPYQSTIKFDSAVMYEDGTATAKKSAYQSAYAIEDISWETTESWNVGIDANILDNKLQFSGDYFKKTTKDMLLELEIPDYLGYDNPDQNTGEMYTNGWEIQLSWNDEIGDFKYSFSANVSDFRSKMGDLGGIEFLGNQVKKKGSEYNEWFGYVSDGIYQTQEELDNSAKMNSAIGLGDIKYVDISGPDGVPDGSITGDYDRVLLGGSLPRFMYGSTLNVSYRNFDLSMTLQGVGKQNVIMSSSMIQPLLGSWINSPKITDGNYWSMYNTDEENANVKYPRLSSTTSSANYSTSDYWMINGAYLRLKNVTISYNLPKSLVEKINLQDIRIYGSANDLFSVNNYPKGWDPEITSMSYYPITTSYIVGVSVKF